MSEGKDKANRTQDADGMADDALTDGMAADGAADAADNTDTATEGTPGDGADMADGAAAAAPRAPWYRRIRWWGWTLIGVAVVILGLLGAFAVQALMIKQHEERAITAVVNAAKSGDMARVSAAVPTMQQETAAAAQLSRSGMWAAAAALPGAVGHDMRTIQDLLDLVHEASVQAVPQYVDIGKAVLADKLVDDGHVEVQPIVDELPAIRKATESLRLLTAEYNALDRPRIGAIAGYYDMGSNALQEAVKYSDMAIDDIIPNLPEWFGYQGTQTYAVLAMTPAEARASGGLVGSIGSVSLTDGKITVGEFEPNTAYWHDGKAFMDIDEKRIYHEDGPLHMTYDVRDVTNYPDTERVAKEFRTMWNKHHEKDPVSLDGVVLVDPVVVQTLVKALGDVTLPDGTVLTGSNTADFLMNTIYIDVDVEEQNEYFGEVAKVCIKRLMANFDVATLAKIGQDIPALAKNRHLAMYSFEPELQQLVQLAGLTAAEPRDKTYPAVGIYLTEVNPSKMDWYVKRTVTVEQLTCSGTGRQQYHVTFTLTNTLDEKEAYRLNTYLVGEEAYGTGAAYDKILFYPPAGGSIGNFTVSGPASLPVSDAIKRHYLFRTLLRLQPGESATYEFDVTTSQYASHQLQIDQTPTRELEPDVTYVKKCTVD